MSELYKIYIDLSGKMAKLDNSIDHMVVIALPDHIDHSVVSTSNQVSPYSSRINTSEIDRTRFPDGEKPKYGSNSSRL